MRHKDTFVKDVVEDPSKYRVLIEEDSEGEDTGLNISRWHVLYGDRRATPANDADVEAENRVYDKTQRTAQYSPSVYDCEFKLYALLSQKAATQLRRCRNCTKVKPYCGFISISELSHASRQSLIRLVEESKIITNNDKEKLSEFLYNPSTHPYRVSTTSDTVIMHGDTLKNFLRGLQ